MFKESEILESSELESDILSPTPQPWSTQHRKPRAQILSRKSRPSPDSWKFVDWSLGTPESGDIVLPAPSTNLLQLLAHLEN